MTEKSNTDLLVACNILSRVESMLSRNSRVQLSNDTLSSVSNYLTKAIKYINADCECFGTQIIVFGKCIESIDELVFSNNLTAIDNETKEYIISKLYPTILEFKINVGKYLTEREFNYTPAMDSVIKDIIDVCIQNGYYFGY